MKKFLLLTSLIIIFGNINLKSQSKMGEIFQNSSYFETTIWDISGEKSEGYLYSSTDSSITISNFSKDSLLIFKANEIYRIKIQKNEAKYIPSIVIFSSLQALNIFMAIMWEVSGDFDFWGALGIGQFIVLPPTLAALMTMNNHKYDLITNTDTLKYEQIYPVLKKYSENVTNMKIKNKVSYYDSISQTKPTLEKNAAKLASIKKPLFFLSPEYISLLHFSVSKGKYNRFFVKNNLRSMINNTYYTGSINYSDYCSKDYILSLRLTKNFRFSYNLMECYNRASIIGLWTEVDIENNTFSVEYVFNPVTRALQNRHEFSCGAGITMSKAEFTIDIGATSQILRFYSLNLHGNYNFYLSKNFSIQTRIFSDISPNVKTMEKEYEVGYGYFNTIPAGKINFSSINFTIGLAIHL